MVAESLSRRKVIFSRVRMRRVGRERVHHGRREKAGCDGRSRRIEGWKDAAWPLDDRGGRRGRVGRLRGADRSGFRPSGRHGRLVGRGHAARAVERRRGGNGSFDGGRYRAGHDGGRWEYGRWGYEGDSSGRRREVRVGSEALRRAMRVQGRSGVRMRHDELHAVLGGSRHGDVSGGGLRDRWM